jgi:hypothetical protein
MNITEFMISTLDSLATRSGDSVWDCNAMSQGEVSNAASVPRCSGSSRKPDKSITVYTAIVMLSTQGALLAY